MHCMLCTLREPSHVILTSILMDTLIMGTLWVFIMPILLTKTLKLKEVAKQAQTTEMMNDTVRL